MNPRRRGLLLVPLCATLAACAAQSAGPPPATAAASDPVVATVGGKPITLAEIDKAAGRELYDLRERTLEVLVVERVIDPEAKKAGKSTDDYLSSLVEARVPEVTEAEASDFFAKNRDRLGPRFEGVKFQDVKPIIIRGLTNEKRKAALASVLEDLKAKAGVEVLMQPPKVVVEARGPARGPADAKVTIVEFSDFQCPYCARGRKVIDEVVQAYGDRVRVVFRDFPLASHENAQKAAEAGQCAHEQGKFWAMHDWMFDHQSQLAPPELSEAARTLGLDAAKFDQCLASGRAAGAVSASQKAGEAAGVRGTPAFVLNGNVISGAQPFERFKEEIDKALTPPKPARQ